MTEHAAIASIVDDRPPSRSSSRAGSEPRGSKPHLGSRWTVARPREVLGMLLEHVILRSPTRPFHHNDGVHGCRISPSECEESILLRIEAPRTRDRVELDAHGNAWVWVGTP